MSSYGQHLCADIAFNIVDLMECVIVIFGVAVFFIDGLLAEYQLKLPDYDTENIITLTIINYKFNVRETSIWCIAFSIFNVFLPNSTINIWIFGPDANDDDATAYTE